MRCSETNSSSTDSFHIQFSIKPLQTFSPAGFMNACLRLLLSDHIPAVIQVQPFPDVHQGHWLCGITLSFRKIHPHSLFLTAGGRLFPSPEISSLDMGITLWWFLLNHKALASHVASKAEERFGVIPQWWKHPQNLHSHHTKSKTCNGTNIWGTKRESSLW